MYFYMNAGTCEREWTYNLIQTKQKKVLKFSNYLEKEQKEENVYFWFDYIDEEIKKGLFFKNATLEINKNRYNVVQSKENDKKEDNILFALLRSTKGINDEIFIPSKMKENVEIIQRLKVIDVEADYGAFLSNIYLIKIELEKNQSLPIFYSYTKPYALMSHDVIYRQRNNDRYSVIKGLTTYILMNDQNKKEYIPLSDM